MYKTSGWWDALRNRVRNMFGGKRKKTDARVEGHFKNQDWGAFDKNLQSASFRKAIRSDSRADPKLKRFVRMQAAIQTNDSPGVKVLSAKGTDSYNVKYDKRLGRYTCTCRDFKYKQFDRAGGKCKHIKKVIADGGLKTSAVEAFGAEYANILKDKPSLDFMIDSAHTRLLRKSREHLQENDEVGTRLRTTEDEPVLPTMRQGRSPTAEDYLERIHDLSGENNAN